MLRPILRLIHQLIKVFKLCLILPSIKDLTFSKKIEFKGYNEVFFGRNWIKIDFNILLIQPKKLEVRKNGPRYNND